MFSHAPSVLEYKSSAEVCIKMLLVHYLTKFQYLGECSSQTVQETKHLLGPIRFRFGASQPSCRVGTPTVCSCLPVRLQLGEDGSAAPGESN